MPPAPYADRAHKLAISMAKEGAETTREQERSKHERARGLS